MRTMKIGVPILLTLAALSLAMLPQEPKAGREPMKYGDRLSRWVGKRFNMTDDRTVAYEWDDPNATFTLVAVGVDYAEFKTRKDTLLMVPLTVIRFAELTPPK